MERHGEDLCDCWPICNIFYGIVLPPDPEPTPEELADDFQRNFEALEAGLNRRYTFPADGR